MSTWRRIVSRTATRGLHDGDRVPLCLIEPACARAMPYLCQDHAWATVANAMLAQADCIPAHVLSNKNTVLLSFARHDRTSYPR